MSLSPDQQQVLSNIHKWFTSKKKQCISIGGYAGTGKTTLISLIRQELAKEHVKLKVAFVSYTGRAARVLKNKLMDQKVMLSRDFVGTIHSLIYSPLVNEKEEIVGWVRKEKLNVDLIIVDEASMVDETIWQHLLSYDIPIIAVGDHGQLPPIQGRFNLMQNPELRLEVIHRQAQENPIIGLSIQAREHGIIRPARYSDSVVKYIMTESDAQEAMNELLSNFTNDTLVLCGYNHTRKKLNYFIRTSLGFDTPYPMTGDRVICLRNNHKKHIFNGMLGTIISLEKKSPEWYDAEIQMDEDQDLYRGLISVSQFESNTALNFTDKRSLTMQGDLFDFGYALTVHKAQGSQAKKVILFEERMTKMSDEDWKRWLYTGVTRAEEELYIFAPTE